MLCAAILLSGPARPVVTVLLGSFIWVVAATLLSGSNCGSPTWVAPAGPSSGVTPPGLAPPWASPERCLLGCSCCLPVGFSLHFFKRCIFMLHEVERTDSLGACKLGMLLYRDRGNTSRRIHFKQLNRFLVLF